MRDVTPCSGTTWCFDHRVSGPVRRQLLCKPRSRTNCFARPQHLASGCVGSSAFRTRSRTAHTTPLASSQQRLELIKTVIEAEHTYLSTRIAALILLLYGIPVRRISELTIDDIQTTAEQTTIQIGALPAPIPEPLLPFFHKHLADRGNHQTMNHRSAWLFPGTRAGHHISEQTLMNRFRSLGINIQAARNAALHDLTKEIDPASLAHLLGYSPKIMNIHAARAAVPMATYPAINRPQPR